MTPTPAEQQQLAKRLLIALKKLSGRNDDDASGRTSGVLTAVMKRIDPVAALKWSEAENGFVERSHEVTAEALGWAAVAAAPHDFDYACDWIDRAVDLYLDARKLARAPARTLAMGARPPMPGASTTIADMPVQAARRALQARAIGYPDFPSVIDRVMSLRPTPADEPSLARRVESSVAMARILALVDPRVARELLTTIEPHVRLLGTGGWSIDRGHWLQARVLADLAHAERLLNDELARLSAQHVPNIAASGLLAAIDVLVLPPQARARFLLVPSPLERTVFWFPDED